jgi:hypothetical protein
LEYVVRWFGCSGALHFQPKSFELVGVLRMLDPIIHGLIALVHPGCGSAVV